MTYKSKYATYENCRFEPQQYGNGNLALQICDDEGLICTCSVNPGLPIPTDKIAIKDYSENEGMVDFLRSQGIIDKLVATIPSGFVEIPVYTLTESGKKIFE